MSETQDAHAEASARPPLDHRLRRMVGRDPNEPNRTATPLELLFDLTFVVAFSQAGAQTAHLLELGHWAPAITGFLFAVFAIWWAWINYSWLASAYDNDDIFFRVATMVEMLGVLMLALGLPALFHSLDEGEHVDNGVVVAGYVVMRVATIALWLRAAKHDTARRRTALTYVVFVSVTQLGWIVAHLRQPAARADARVHGRPDRPRARRAVRRRARPRGRHAVARAPHRRALRPARHHHPRRDHPRHDPRDLGRGRRAGLVGRDDRRGVRRHRARVRPVVGVLHDAVGQGARSGSGERGFVWGYLHYFIFVALAGAGAGLHVAAYEIEGVAHIGIVQALLTVVVPVGIFMVALFTIYSLLLRQFDPFHIWLFIGSVVVLVLAVVAVAAGATFGVGILITAASPFVVVVGYETVGHRHQAAALRRALGD